MVEKKTSIGVWESVKLLILSLWIVTRGYPIIAPCSKRMLLCVGICLAPTCGAISDVIIIVARISNTERYMDYKSWKMDRISAKHGGRGGTGPREKLGWLRAHVCLVRPTSSIKTGLGTRTLSAICASSTGLLKNGSKLCFFVIIFKHLLRE